MVCSLRETNVKSFITNFDNEKRKKHGQIGSLFAAYSRYGLSYQDFTLSLGIYDDGLDRFQNFFRLCQKPYP